MKIIASMPLHYGLDYLAHAIRSVIDTVDELHVQYEARGTQHGGIGGLSCPDTREDLYRVCLIEAGDKLRWHEGNWFGYGYQRDAAFLQYCPDADVCITLDSDEVWYPGLAQAVIDATKDSGQRSIRVPMNHYWRSLKRAVLNDPAFPTRVIYVQNQDYRSEMTYHAPGELDKVMRIAHLGYAQRSTVVHYKQTVHGHMSEWRVNWYHSRFAVNAQEDVHPTSKNYWNPVPVQVPEFLADHPYAQLEVIP